MSEPSEAGPKTPPIDPTKNVLDLVNFERVHRDALRDADEKYHRDMREADRRRADDLANQKDAFDLRQSEILRVQVSNNAALVSTQLDRITTVLSDRLAELERSRYENAGRSIGIGLMFTGAIAIAGIATTITTLVIKLAGSP